MSENKDLKKIDKSDISETLHNQVDLINASLKVREEKPSNHESIEEIRYKARIKELEDKNRELEYQLFQLNEQYQEISSRSLQISKILLDANEKASQVEQTAQINAKDTETLALKNFLDSIETTTLTQEELAKVNYFKAVKNLSIIKEAIIMLQDKLKIMLDDIHKNEETLAILKIKDQ